MNYEFAFNGAEYSGNQFAFLTEGTIPDKLRINDAYQVGDTITIYVNPANPNQSVVERRSLLWRYTWKPLLGIVLTVCIAVLVTFSVCGKVQPLARPSVAGQQ